MRPTTDAELDPDTAASRQRRWRQMAAEVTSLERHVQSWRPK